MRPSFDNIARDLRQRRAPVVRLLVDGEEPLGGDARLDHGLAAVAFAERHQVILHADQRTAGLEIGDDALARRVTVESLVGAGVFVHVRALIHDHKLFESVALAGFEVVGIVSRA